MAKIGAENWAAAARRRKFKFAGHTARRHDMRWSQRLLDWRLGGGARGVGRPCKRWEDDIFHRAGGQWEEAAQDRDMWRLCEDFFVAGL